jgi:hypothetical protein
MTSQQIRDILARKSLLRQMLSDIVLEAALLHGLVNDLDPDSNIIEWTTHADELLSDGHKELTRASDHLGETTQALKDLGKEIFTP